MSCVTFSYVWTTISDWINRLLLYFGIDISNLSSSLISNLSFLLDHWVWNLPVHDLTPDGNPHRGVCASDHWGRDCSWLFTTLPLPWSSASGERERVLFSNDLLNLMVLLNCHMNFVISTPSCCRLPVPLESLMNAWATCGQFGPLPWRTWRWNYLVKNWISQGSWMKPWEWALVYSRFVRFNNLWSFKEIWCRRNMQFSVLFPFPGLNLLYEIVVLNRNIYIDGQKTKISGEREK